MKKLYAVGIACSMFFLGLSSSYSQSIKLIDPPSVITAKTDQTEAANYINVKNESFLSTTIQVKRTIDEAAPNHEVIFCFGGQCYGEEQDVSDPYTMKPGETTNQTYAFNPKLEGIYGAPGTTKVTYTFYSTSDPEDKLIVQFTYVVSDATTGVEPEVQVTATVLSNTFPSPALDNTRISYSIGQPYSQASIAVYNMLGAPVQTIALNAPNGTVSIPTAAMNSGVYFYSIIADGKKIATKKLIVKH